MKDFMNYKKSFSGKALIKIQEINKEYVNPQTLKEKIESYAVTLAQMESLPKLKIEPFVRIKKNPVIGVRFEYDGDDLTLPLTIYLNNLCSGIRSFNFLDESESDLIDKIKLGDYEVLFKSKKKVSE